MSALGKGPDYDYILVGGGLQAGLLALALEHHHPDARVLMVERAAKIAGNHTWSFHPGDVDDACRDWVKPLIEYQWDGYGVHLDRFDRRVGLAYASTSSEHFAQVVRGRFHAKAQQAPKSVTKIAAAVAAGVDSPRTTAPWSDGAAAELPGDDHRWRLLTETEIAEVSANRVVTRDGRSWHGRLVIDCRGPAASLPVSGCGYQKFFGFEVELSEDWQASEPVVMESVADQQDGFRFLYTLPFHSRRVLIEDTRFSDSPGLDRDECLAVVTRYLRDRGFDDFTILREESGVLPMPFSRQLQPGRQVPLAGGYAGGWFHAATGYSFPLAVAFAQAVAAGPIASAADRVQELAERHRVRAIYARFLNRLLFRLVAPRQRQQIFRRFYRVLSERSVERFYAHRFTAGDAFRIVVGMPPTLVGLRPIRFFRSFFSGASQ